jgi:hypothetical protein
MMTIIPKTDTAISGHTTNTHGSDLALFFINTENIDRCMSLNLPWWSTTSIRHGTVSTISGKISNHMIYNGSDGSFYGERVWNLLRIIRIGRRDPLWPRYNDPGRLAWSGICDTSVEYYLEERNGNKEEDKWVSMDAVLITISFRGDIRVSGRVGKGGSSWQYSSGQFEGDNLRSYAVPLPERPTVPQVHSFNYQYKNKNFQFDDLWDVNIEIVPDLI